jgi:hypothetical protein
MMTPVTQVWEEQRIVTKENGGFVAEVRCTNDAPKGDCFVAIVQLYAATQGTAQAKFRVTMKVTRMVTYHHQRVTARCYVIRRHTHASGCAGAGGWLAEGSVLTTSGSSTYVNHTD